MSDSSDQRVRKGCWNVSKDVWKKNLQWKQTMKCYVDKQKEWTGTNHIAV